MNRHFIFGPVPGLTVLGPLGLDYAVEVTRPAVQIHAEAVARLDDWCERCRRAEQNLTGLPSLGVAPGSLGGARRLLCEARRAGSRVWLEAVFNTPAVVADVADLSAWCRLQVRALRCIEGALPAAILWVPGEDVLEDAELLEEASPLLSAVGPGQEGAASQVARWADLSRLCLGDDWDGYVEEADCLSQEGRPLPTDLPQSEQKALLRRAWNYLAPVAERSGAAPPSGPRPVGSIRDCVDALTSLLGWCSGASRGAQGCPAPNGEALADGPILPAQFRFRGKPYGEFTAGELKLLDLLWRDRTTDRYSAVEIDRLVKQLSAPKRVRPGAVLSTKSRLSKKFLNLGVPASLEKSQGYLVLTISP